MPFLKTYITNKNLFLFGILLVIVGMPLSRFLISLGQFVLLGNWIIEGDFKRKWQVMKTSKVLWVMSSFFIMHLVGLLWTSDFNYAANDLRIKLPLLWFPLLFITSKPLDKKEIEAFLWLFVSSVFISVVVCTLVWLGYTKHKVVDIRDISIFNSHIRFALMIDLCICFLLYDFFKTSNWFLYIIKTTLIVYFIIFLGIMQSFTGILILGIVFVYYSFLFIKRLEKIQIKIAVFSIIGLVFSFLIYSIVNEIKEQLIPTKPLIRLEKTRTGHLYYTDENSAETENGNLVWANICDYELTKEWNRRSAIKFNEKDKKQNPIYATVIRYLSSRGFNKDSAGLSMLSDNEIANIEKGVSNYKYSTRSGIKNRIHEILLEHNAYKNGADPTGHSFLMRLEFWRVGFDIIKRKWVFGVGTGDVQSAYINQYGISKSKLMGDWRRRSHNQFMAITIAFGVIGLLVFLFYLFYPVFMVKNKHYLFSVFFIISILSMLNEDTLETQAGVTFFGFFYGLLCLNYESHICSELENNR